MYMSAPTYMLCNGFTKLSLLTFYLPISPQTWFLTSVWTMIGIVILYTPIITILLIFSCSPLAVSWDVTIVGGQCIDKPALYIATAVSNIVTDVVLFILPMRMVFGLRMRIWQKLGAMFVFGIGSVYVALSLTW
jgi:hypothetical protein